MFEYDKEMILSILKLEEFELDELIENYGISMQEYLRPTSETIRKVAEKLNSIQNKRSR